jgi:DNA polymerase-3 subunit delta
VNLDPSRLTEHLRRPLAAAYLLTGDEPLQETECGDAIRAEARRQGYTERAVFQVQAHFDWETVRLEGQSLSLFAARRLIEVRLGERSPDETGSQWLTDFVSKPPPDTLLLLIADALDSKRKKSAWAGAFDKHGVVLSYKPPDAAHMPAWVRERMASRHLKPSPEAVTALAERAEGNLLAAAQEIEKLVLLCPDGVVEVPHVLDAVADNARFAVFGWLDTLLAGEARRVSRQLHVLNAEGTEPLLLLGLLSRELRMLCHLAWALRAGQPEAQALAAQRVWSTRKSLVLKALKRHPPARWQAMLREAHRLEAMAKGYGQGNVWDDLERLGLRVAGVTL